MWRLKYPTVEGEGGRMQACYLLSRKYISPMKVEFVNCDDTHDFLPLLLL